MSPAKFATSPVLHPQGTLHLRTDRLCGTVYPALFFCQVAVELGPDVTPVILTAANRLIPHIMDLSTLRSHKAAILRLAEAFGASNVQVFGSVARGEAGPESDLDLVVDMAPSTSLLTWGAFREELESLLGAKVDLAISTDLRPEVRNAILREALPL